MNKTNSLLSKAINPLPMLGAFLAETQNDQVREELLSRILVFSQDYNPWEKPKEGPFGSCIGYLLRYDTSKKEQDLFASFLKHPMAPPASQWNKWEIRTQLYNRNPMQLPLPLAIAAVYPFMLPNYIEAGASLDACDKKGRTCVAYLGKDHLEDWFEQVQKQNVSLFYDDLAKPIKHALLDTTEHAVFHKAALRALRKFPVVQKDQTPEDKWSEILKLIQSLQGKNTVLGQIKALECESRLTHDHCLLEAIEAFDKGFTSLFREKDARLRSFPKNQQSGIVSLGKYIMRLASNSSSPDIQKRIQLTRAIQGVASGCSDRWSMSPAFHRYLTECQVQCKEMKIPEDVLVKACQRFHGSPEMVLAFLRSNKKDLNDLLHLANRNTLSHVPLHSLGEIVVEACENKNSAKSKPLDTFSKQQLGRLMVESLVERADEWNTSTSSLFASLCALNNVSATVKVYRSFKPSETEIVSECLNEFFASNMVKPLGNPPASRNEAVLELVGILQSKAMNNVLSHVVPTKSEQTTPQKKKM